MGYRIGFQCFETQQAATDYKMSLVVPTITADGTLVHPIKQGDTWMFSGHPVQLQFGECDPAADLYAGVEFAMAFTVLMAVAWAFRFLIGYIISMSKNIAGNDE